MVPSKLIILRRRRSAGPTLLPSLLETGEGGKYEEPSLFGVGAAILLVGTAVIIPMAGVACAAGATVGFEPASALAISGGASISCSSRIDCTVVGSGATIEAETNGQWGTPFSLPIPVPAVGEYFNSVSCSSAGDCTAVGQAEGNTEADGEAGIVATETSGTWGAVTLIPEIGEGSPLASVSCSDALDCTAVGWDGNSDPLAVTKTDGNWGVPVELYPGGARVSHRVSSTASVVSAQEIAPLLEWMVLAVVRVRMFGPRPTEPGARQPRSPTPMPSMPSVA